MSDTMQLVRWALEQSCGLRQGEAARDPVAALAATERARTFAEYFRWPCGGFRIYGDICVTSHTYVKKPGDGTGPGYPYPGYGFVVAKAFEPQGGIERILATCATCPANTKPHDPARCGGMLHKYPDDDETQVQLEQIVNRLGLGEQLRASFPVTTPLWYAFWMQSPMPPSAAPVLASILTEMAKEDGRDTQADLSWRRRHVRDLHTFVRALQIAAEGRMTLHVSLAPPSQIEFGLYFVFSHCPRCKAQARIRRRQRGYPSELHECRVCGTKFPPTETVGSQRDNYEEEDLRNLLGQTAFEAFAAECLMAHGATPEASRTIVAEAEKAERARRAEWKQHLRRQEQRETWLHTVLYAGLKAQWIEHEGLKPAPMFAAGAFAEVLRRVRERKLTIVALSHRSKSAERNKYEEFRSNDRVEEVFAQWQAEGCNELFGAIIDVPDSLLD